MKTSELTGPALNNWVAKALGWEQRLWGAIPVWFDPNNENRFRCNVAHWKPSEDWAQAGPLIDEYNITLGETYTKTEPHKAMICTGHITEATIERGQTKLIAAMRCVVASKFGDEVPDE